MLSVGDKAPAFELPDADMNMCLSQDLEGSNYVIYFYPKDDTPGCTMEAQEFSDLLDEFVAHNTKLIGVSKDNCKSHGEFRDKYGLTVQLLAVSFVMTMAFGKKKRRMVKRNLASFVQHSLWIHKVR